MRVIKLNVDITMRVLDDIADDPNTDWFAMVVEACGGVAFAELLELTVLGRVVPTHHKEDD